MAASANSIKKNMKMEHRPDGTIDMYIHIQMRPNGLTYVDGRPIGGTLRGTSAEASLNAIGIADHIVKEYNATHPRQLHATGL